MRSRASCSSGRIRQLPRSRATFEGAAIPRIRSSPPEENLEYGSTYWLDQLAANPESRFVSDGDPDTITVPAGEAGQVAKQYRSKVTQG